MDTTATLVQAVRKNWKSAYRFRFRFARGRHNGIERLALIFSVRDSSQVRLRTLHCYVIPAKAGIQMIEYISR
jgi:hypothetical protein